MTDRRTKAMLAALDAATLSLREIAAQAGISEDSVYAYRMGARRPSEETISAVVKTLTRHQQRLAKALEKLRQASQ